MFVPPGADEWRDGSMDGVGGAHSTRSLPSGCVFLCAATMLTQATSLYQGGREMRGGFEPKMDGKKKRGTVLLIRPIHQPSREKERRREGGRDGKQKKKTFSNANFDFAGWLFSLSNKLTIVLN